MAKELGDDTKTAFFGKVAMVYVWFCAEGGSFDSYDLLSRVSGTLASSIGCKNTYDRINVYTLTISCLQIESLFHYCPLFPIIYRRQIAG